MEIKFDAKFTTQKNMKIILDTLDELLNMYPCVQVNTIGDIYSRDGEYNNKLGYSAQYFVNDRAIWVNTFNEFREHYITLNKREKKFKTIEIRKNINKDLLKYVEPFDVLGGSDLVSVIYHEFGHVLEHQLNICEIKEVINIFSNLSKENLEKKLSIYAAKNISEFIAEAFTESMFENSRYLGIKMRGIIDNAYLEKSNTKF
ncbi:hypothetical protein [Clostridium scatologenes]|uniref:Uncharacterized protein n=1 Tax=Clostridium scatologenes TaxID=1548 RepID=A0A0E3MA31_CLOSL|nr:hypothetical protein [Clostridium scatologenes]AKA70153.1 hypothetical protein CSCA_3028 [Clostridium scatologenes]